MNIGIILALLTVGQAKFYLEHAGQDFAPIEQAHAQYHAVLDGVRGLVPPSVKHQVIDRAFLPQFTFGENDLVVAVGPDGLVVNIAKYLDGQPILAVNPDPKKIEGVLLPFTTKDFWKPFTTGIYGDPPIKRITMAETLLNDGQRLLAFNDFFVGASLVYGVVTKYKPLVITSQMADNGIIFSDGVEADYLAFNAGFRATIRVAEKKAHLVMPS
jgi:NAD kinase